MTLENNLNITESVELAHTEEKISKKKAALLFESGYLNTLKAGTLESIEKCPSQHMMKLLRNM